MCSHSAGCTMLTSWYVVVQSVRTWLWSHRWLRCTLLFVFKGVESLDALSWLHAETHWKSTHPPVWQTCKVLYPWALLCETTVFAYLQCSMYSPLTTGHNWKKTGIIIFMLVLVLLGAVSGIWWLLASKGTLYIWVVYNCIWYNLLTTYYAHCRYTCVHTCIFLPHYILPLLYSICVYFYIWANIVFVFLMHAHGCMFISSLS